MGNSYIGDDLQQQITKLSGLVLLQSERLANQTEVIEQLSQKLNIQSSANDNDLEHLTEKINTQNGVNENNSINIQMLSDDFDNITNELEKFNQRIDTINILIQRGSENESNRFQILNGKVDNHTKELQEFNQRIDNNNEEIGLLDSKLNVLEAKFGTLNETFTQVKSDIRSLTETDLQIELDLTTTNNSLSDLRAISNSAIVGIEQKLQNQNNSMIQIENTVEALGVNVSEEFFNSENVPYKCDQMS